MLPHSGREDAALAILFPPWLEREMVVDLGLAAGHHVLRTGRLGSILIVAPPEPGRAPAPLPQRAWFAFSLSGLAGCLDRSDALPAA